MARFELLEGTGATHVPDRFRSGTAKNVTITSISYVTAWFRRIVATIPRQLSGTCRYVDFTSDERCPVFLSVLGRVVRFILSRTATLVGRPMIEFVLEMEKQRGSGELPRNTEAPRFSKESVTNV